MDYLKPKLQLQPKATVVKTPIKTIKAPKK